VNAEVKKYAAACDAMARASLPSTAVSAPPSAPSPAAAVERSAMIAVAMPATALPGT
jgi:hypothetical protein